MEHKTPHNNYFLLKAISFIVINIYDSGKDDLHLIRKIIEVALHKVTRRTCFHDPFHLNSVEPLESLSWLSLKDSHC